MVLTGNNLHIDVRSEIGRLRCLLIHSPDSGIGKVVPSKAQDWLFEDIIHLDSVRKNEYDLYVKLLMYFLDPERINGRLDEISSPEHKRNFFKPDNAGFHASAKVIEMQTLLSDILEDNNIREKLVASVCAMENCTYSLQETLINTEPVELAKILISGSMDDHDLIFAPIPNFIFSRDVGIAIKDHLLISKPAKPARARETLLMRYVFFNHPLFKAYRNNIIEIPDTPQHFLKPGEGNEERTTLEGGDIMMISEEHVLIGVSERTSVAGANAIIRTLFDKKLVKKATVIKIPTKRDFMHIDTIFTQVKRNVWVLLGSLSMPQFDPETATTGNYFSQQKPSKTVEIVQFNIDKGYQPKRFVNLEALLDDISRNEFKSEEPTRFIYSGDKEFPYDAREQWTDSCNLLALQEGVVIGYDRNDKTAAAFEKNGFKTISVADLLLQIEQGETDPQSMKDTLILMPSAELSRARGGFHCMSMPLCRETIDK
ncbi:arginine deiminase family protein [Mucilaginibacter myungsuensis]|uniref:arginine deiminase n=1 Tax=Mucilaginibacter myungsuensis TaxID=649104 RepID=A0A929L1M2_9SPHI|nr:arginine deiminase family protein [Mucilaginibacter myungsuensis]MBE9664600.1 amidinotransferase [Mucilaginibacter myungsuensis]MDN3601050.1 arginine deiminase family protein [Mucilaginibacter myungsuensis]